MPTEIELKLAIAPSDVGALLRHPALQAVKRGPLRTRRLLAHYYDTPDARLARDDLALRVRRVGQRWIQTLKGPADATGGAGLQVRGEWEWPVRGEALDTALLATTPWHKEVAKALRRGGLVRCFSTEFERRGLPLAFPDGTRAALAVDRGEIRAACDRRLRRAPISEVEIELESGDAANLYRLALAWMEDLPLGVLVASKAERGHALGRGARLVHDEPVHAARVELRAEATATEALATVARECLHQIAANASGLLADRDPEWIHQMRVGTRRLRSCLSLYAHAAPEIALDEVKSEIKWLARCLGHARDADVFAASTLPPFAASFARDDVLAPGIARMRARAATRRRAARAAARQAVASPRFHRLLLSTGLAFASAGLEPGSGDRIAGAKSHADATPPGATDAMANGVAAPPIERADAFAAALLERRHDELLAHGLDLAHVSDRERHAARIAAKRLRYAAEFFASLFGKKRTRRYLESLAELQEVLGLWNDAATASAHAEDAGGTTSAPAAAAMRGWAAAQGSALAPRLTKAGRGFRACPPFWH
jgi:inorganic triphosphatase YgiF